MIFILFYTHYYAVVGFDVVSAFSYINRHEIASNYSGARIPHNKSCNPSPIQTPPPATIILHSSPLDDFLDNIFGNDDNNKKNSDDSSTNNEENNNRLEKDENDEEDENNMSLSSFQQELAKRQLNIEAPTDDDDQQQQQRQLESPNSGSSSSSSVQIEVQQQQQQQQQQEEEEEFDGYDLRDIIQAKYGICYDVEFQRVDVGGFRSVYLNIMPFRLGGKRFRHATEFDYLCHLQAVAEILMKYNQLEYVLTQLGETTKKPRGNTSPLVAVPLRLDLTPEQVNKILN